MLSFYGLNNFTVFAGAMCLTFDISSSCQTMACGDNTGHIHIFSNVSSGPVINTYSRPSEMPDTPTVYPSFSIDDCNTPLSVIPMPIVHHELSLSSNWPADFMQKVYRLEFFYFHYLSVNSFLFSKRYNWFIIYIFF